MLKALRRAFVDDFIDSNEETKLTQFKTKVQRQ